MVVVYDGDGDVWLWCMVVVCGVWCDVWGCIVAVMYGSDVWWWCMVVYGGCGGDVWWCTSCDN